MAEEPHTEDAAGQRRQLHAIHSEVTGNVQGVRLWFHRISCPMAHSDATEVAPATEAVNFMNTKLCMHVRKRCGGQGKQRDGLRLA